jgi:hypothetical protein
MFNLVATGSLLLCIGTVALWMRSYYAYDRFQISRCVASEYHDIGFVWSSLSVHGGWKLQLQRDQYGKGSYRVAPRHQSGSARLYPLYPFFGIWDSTRGKSVLETAGFEFTNSYSGNPPEIIRGVIAPFWSFSLIFLILPLLWLRFRLQSRATHDRWPECGTIPQKDNSKGQRLPTP